MREKGKKMNEQERKEFEDSLDATADLFFGNMDGDDIVKSEPTISEEMKANPEQFRNIKTVKQEITNILSTVKQPSRKQYPVAKHQIASLTELGLIELMPASFGYTDAATIISAAKDAGGKQIGEGDTATNSDASKLYTLLNEVEEVKTVELENAVLILGNVGDDYSNVAMEAIVNDGRNPIGSGGTWHAKHVDGIVWFLETWPLFKGKTVEVYRVTKNQHSFFHRGLTTDSWTRALSLYGLERLN